MLIFQSAARVAELVDAHGSGPCDLTIMGVRVPPRAPVRPGQETGPVFCCLAKVLWVKGGLRVKMCVWLGVSRGLDLAFLNAD